MIVDYFPNPIFWLILKWHNWRKHENATGAELGYGEDGKSKYKWRWTYGEKWYS